MSDKDYMNQSERHRVRAWILHEMLAGAGKAALVVVTIGLAILVIYFVSQLLPPESKQAPSPSLSAIEAPMADRQLA